MLELHPAGVGVRATACAIGEVAGGFERGRRAPGAGPEQQLASAEQVRPWEATIWRRRPLRRHRRLQRAEARGSASRDSEAWTHPAPGRA